MKRVLSLFVLVMLIAVGGCNDTIKVGDSLDIQGIPMTLCVNPEPREVLTLGDTMISCNRKQPVTITEVSLVNAKDLTLNDAVIVKLNWGEEDMVGLRAWPPPDDVAKNWHNRINAEGAVLEPGDSWNLVVSLVGDAPEFAFAEKIRIVYEDMKGRQYEQYTLTKIYFNFSSLECDEITEKYP